MAKLGMPSVNIAFEEAGIEAIERSKRGIVALILEEPQDTITKLLTDHNGTDNSTIKAITNPFVIFTTDDIPSELTDNNKDYIKKCLIGYTKTPYRVRVYLQATGDESWLRIDSTIWPFQPLPKHSVKLWLHGLRQTVKTSLRRLRRYCRIMMQTMKASSILGILPWSQRIRPIHRRNIPRV